MSGDDGPSGPDLRALWSPGSTQDLVSPPCLPAPPHLLTASQQPHQTQGTQYGSLGHARALPCPSIHITAIAPNSHVELSSSTQGAEDALGSGGPEQAWLSLEPRYRDTALSPSPCSSLSSRSWLSDLSSCESFSHVYDDVEGELEEAAARFALSSPRASPLPSPRASPLPSPGYGVGGGFGVELWQQQYQHPSPAPSPRHSPRSSVTEENWLTQRPSSRTSSRPTSPCGKRRHSGGAEVRARSPSPHCSPSPTPGPPPRGSLTEDSWLAGPLLYGIQELNVPSKTRRTAGSQPDHSPGHSSGLTPGLEDVVAALPFLDTCGNLLDPCGNREVLPELFLPVPPSISWSKPRPSGGPPLFSTSSLPPLDWPLPCSWGPAELQLVVGPRPFHRAHYETEGSRGAIKTASGGHPVIQLHGYSEQPLVVQVFMAMAEETTLRPHPFYQVHRVTGKSVTTACQEAMLDGTKVLDIPLLPEHNMTASIDCVGILKLRNADIELRKGDLGRRNTRVRVGYRVNIPQLHGDVLCLQTASVPIECSQRLALELPQVVEFSPATGSGEGGEEMTIRGTNISTHSRVIFTQKEPDGRSQWEAEALAVPDKSSASGLVVRIPPYRGPQAGGAVHFYVSNGKKRRSPSYGFTYLNTATHHFLSPEGADAAPLLKQECWDLDYIPHNPPGLRPPASQEAFHPQVPFNKAPGDYGSSAHALHSPLGSSPVRPHPQPRSIAMTTAYPTAVALAYDNQSDGPLRYKHPVPDSPVSRCPGRAECLHAPPPSTTCPPVTCQMGRGYWEDAPSPHSLFCQGAEPVRVKQEVEESLQEITLDEVNEIIDRDFFGLSEEADQSPSVVFSETLH